MVAILPRGSATFQGALSAAGPRRDPFQEAQLEKPHDLVTPCTAAVRLRRSHPGSAFSYWGQRTANVAHRESFKLRTSGS